MIGLGGFADTRQHTAPHHSAAADHIDTAGVDGLVFAALGARHPKELVVHGIGVFKAQPMPVDHGVIVFLQSHGQGGHRGHRAGHADDGTGLACVHGAEGLIDMFIDVRNGRINLCLGRRIVGQMTFGHAHGTDVHGKRALNLGSGRTDAVATDDQLGGPAAEVNHQIGGGQIVAIDHGSGAEEAQVGFFSAGNDFGAHAEDTFNLILELLTVFRVTSGGGGNETQAVDGMLGNHTGEFPSGHIGAFQRFVGKTMGLVHILTKADHTQDARHHLMHAIGIDTCDLQSNGVRAAINAGDGYGFLAHCLLLVSSYPLVRMNGLFAVAHLLINRPVCNGRRSDRTRL